jgi:periplasmic copper chaperone A
MRHFLCLAALLIAGCGTKPVESVTGATVTLPAVPGRPGAAYFTLNGGAADNRLMQVSSPQSVRIELHESSMKNGMMTMNPLEGGVAVPAGGKVIFAPGGKHAMLFDLNPKIGPGTTMRLSFTYANGRVIEAEAAVKAAGDTGGHMH